LWTGKAKQLLCRRIDEADALRLVNDENPFFEAAKDMLPII
jgi:hypothetical protein